MNKKQTMIRLNENYRYKVHDEVAIEDFVDGSLLLLCDQLRMVELNHAARRIIGLMNGRRDLRQIIKTISVEFNMEERIVRKDIQRLVNELGLHGAVRPLVRVVVKRRIKMGKSLELMANPDVSLREEEDGAILFNVDTNALLIINPIGLVIWKFMKALPRTRGDIVDHLKEVCESVPLEQVEEDVDKFINELCSKGFIGEVVDEKKAQPKKNHKKT